MPAQVADVEDLPNCTANREGKKYSVEGEEETYVCKDGVWEEVTDDESYSNARLASR